MAIRVLLADSSDVMRPAIVRLLEEEPLIELLGEVTSFAQTLQLTAKLKPDVLLMDVHLRDEEQHPPALVGPQLLLNAKCVLGISFWNDSEVCELAKSYGARMLLDKSKLYSELIPAIKEFCPVAIPKHEEAFEEVSLIPCPASP